MISINQGMNKPSIRRFANGRGRKGCGFGAIWFIAMSGSMLM